MPQQRITVFIKLKPYLKAFLVSVYGKEPIFFPRSKEDRFVNIIEKLLIKPPENYQVEQLDREQHIEVILPFYMFTNIYSKNYISHKSQRIFEERVNSIFWEVYYDFMDDCLSDDISRNLATNLFIEKYNLPYTAQLDDMLTKGLYRSKKLLRKYPLRKYQKAMK
jgi:hypothetical protein